MHKAIELYFSDSVEALALKLSNTIKSNQKKVDIFNPQNIIVPNANMAKYLQVTLADNNKVCCNVNFNHFEKGLWQALSNIVDVECDIINQNVLNQLVLIALSEGKKQDELKIFNDYIYNSGGIAQRKLWQLSTKLATRFMEYQLHRPEMIESWQKNQLFFSDVDDDIIDLELAQRTLYVNIFQNGLRNKIAPKSKTLFEFANYVMHKGGALDGSDVAEKENLYIFTPSRLAGFHRKLFCNLSKYYNLHIYHLNVCCEFWEDVTSNSEDNWFAKFRQLEPDSLMSELPEDKSLENDLLKSWGKPGREALKMYSNLELDTYYFNINFENTWLEKPEESKDTLLKTIQSDVLLRRSSKSINFSPEQMRSLQITGAPSLEREVESVYNSILYNLEINPDLKLNDIAVLVTDMDTYRTMLEVVFERVDEKNKRVLDYCLVDSSCSTESIYVQGVEILFKLIEGDYIRSDLFDMLRNPCVQKACGISDDDIERFLLLCERAGIYRGYDKLYSGDKSIEKIFTWQEGLRRLRLGAIAEFDTPFDQYFLVSNSNPEDVATLTLILESLLKYKNIFASSKLPMQWAQLLADFFDDFLDIPDDCPQEISVQNSLNQVLNKLDLIEAANLRLNFEDISYYISQEMGGLHAGKGNYLSGAVVLASLQPMRPIPFKITYILGLGESIFPGSIHNDSLDLRLYNRKLGDVNLIESMNYLFLETLICSREKLYLSYINEDIKTNTEKMPSSVLTLLSDYCKRLNDRFKINTLSLNAHEDINYHINNDLDTDFGYMFNKSYWQQLQAEKQNPINVELVKEISLIKNYDAKDEITHIDINCLAKFLQNPALELLSRNGIVDTQIDQASLVEEEPFELDYLQNWSIFSQALDSYIGDKTNKRFEDYIQAEYNLRLRNWQLPIELFSQPKKIASAISDAEKFKNLFFGKKLSGPVVFGSSITTKTASIKLPSLNLQLKTGKKIELTGSLDNVFVDGNCLQQALVFKTSSARLPSKHLLKPFLFWCSLIALQDTNIEIDPLFEVLITGKKSEGKFVCYQTIDEELLWSKSKARQYLSDLVEDYLQAKPYYLPFDLITKYQFNQEGSYNLDDYQKYYSEATDALETDANINLLNLLDIEFPQDAMDIYHRRFNAFIKMASSGQSKAKRGK